MVGGLDVPLLVRGIWKVSIRGQAAIAMGFPAWLAVCKLTCPSRAGTACSASNRQHLFLDRFHQSFPLLDRGFAAKIPDIPASVKWVAKSSFEVEPASRLGSGQGSLTLVTRKVES